jgi:hypothetical protein
MNKTPFALAAGVLLSAVIPAFAQTEPPPAPKVLQIYREQVKPGKTAAHEKVEAGWPRAFAKANSPDHYVALSSVTGSGEAWFITAYDTFAAYEKSQEFVDKNPALKAETEALSAQDGELLSGIASILAIHREDLSYRPAVHWPKMRFVQVTTVRINQGRANDYAALGKVVNSAHDKAKMDEQWSVYEVVSGMPTPTYLIFQGMKSLADMDALREMHGKAYQDGLGEENRARIRELQNQAVSSSTSQIFAMSPKMSYVSKEFAAADPSFWSPAPAPLKIPAKQEKK